MFKEGNEYEITSKKLLGPVTGIVDKIVLGILVVQGTKTEGVYGIKLEDVESYRVLDHAGV